MAPPRELYDEMKLSNNKEIKGSRGPKRKITYMTLDAVTNFTSSIFHFIIQLLFPSLHIQFNNFYDTIPKLHFHSLSIFRYL
ncbi:hypothetical protein RIF29_17848 [Crotalaria pallida]|uniref:Uncharacterized protein n=1 Tax=Crotalaria pallida TaxID=3830 RepID=A0AAN9FPT5_CROPI